MPKKPALAADTQPQGAAPATTAVTSLPPLGYSRLKAVLPLVPFGRATVWRKVAAGQFPAPCKVAGVTAWRNDELRAWLAAQGRPVGGGQ